MTVSFYTSEHSINIQERLRAFMDTHIYPNEGVLQDQLDSAENRFSTPPIIEELKTKAKTAGLWNLFFPPEGDQTGVAGEVRYGVGLTNLEYAPLCEIMGRVEWASEVFNCNAPDTGNMEVLARYGTEEQQATWLEPLLAGDIRSCFAMTEPHVASSDATNISSSIVRDGNEYVLNGHKWWATQSPRTECKILVFMGKTDVKAERYRQQSMILVPIDTPGIEIVRALDVFGYDSAPVGHGEIRFTDVRVPTENIILGEGRGFEIAQGRLGPGRIHHCMRLIGIAERALEAMRKRAQQRIAFGQALADKGALRHQLAECRIAIDQARLLTLHAAHMMDTVGTKAARREIAMIKVVAPRMACQVLDRAIQIHGAAGVSPDFWLAAAYAHARTLRLADGPDEVHLESIAKSEFRNDR